MEKLIYIIEHMPSQLPEDFEKALLNDVVPAMRLRGARQITANIADMNDKVETDRTRTERIHGDWHKVAGAVHFWLNSLDTRDRIEELLTPISGNMSGYLVTESLVQGCERTWSGTVRRPGVTQFALGKKPAHVTDEHFYHHWQDIHGPWSFQLHPRRQSYVRNAVARCLTSGAASWRFIVLEHFAELEDFTDEDRYYANEEVVSKLWQDVPEFLDLTDYAGGPMSEYFFE